MANSPRLKLLLTQDTLCQAQSSKTYKEHSHRRIDAFPQCFPMFSPMSSYCLSIRSYPPTPAASRGSALEEDLLATRGQKRKADTQEEGKKREAARSEEARRREEARSSYRGLCWPLRQPQLPEKSQPQDEASKLEAGSAGKPAE